MCSNVMVQHRPIPYHRLRRNSIFELTQNEPIDLKGPDNDDVRGNVSMFCLAMQGPGLSIA